jgi:hypothetical protein
LDWGTLIDVKAANNGNPHGRKKVRDGDVTGDMSSYDMCNLFVGQLDDSGVPTNPARLMVAYDIEFFKPQMSLQHDPVASEYTQSLTKDPIVLPGTAVPIPMTPPPTNTNGRNFTAATTLNGHLGWRAPQQGQYRITLDSEMEIRNQVDYDTHVQFQINDTDIKEGGLSRLRGTSGLSTSIYNNTCEFIVYMAKNDILSLIGWDTTGNQATLRAAAAICARSA